jgi:electron transfer flavoprotein beta subunit
MSLAPEAPASGLVRMKVVVTVKPVADPNTAPTAWIAHQRGEQAGDINFVANYFDLIAVEQAIRLKDDGVTDICVVSVTGDDHLAQVRSAIAMGVGRAVLINPEGKRLGWYQIASALKFVIDREKPDFVLMGKQATDDDASQVGPILAGMLGWPQATFVSEMRFSPTRSGSPASGLVRVGRETDEGVEVLDVRLPAVITCDLRLNEPRYATLPNLIKSKKAPIERFKFSELGLPAEPKVSVERYELPAGRTGQVRMVADTAQLVAALRERKLIG